VHLERKVLSDVDVTPSGRLVYYWTRTLANRDGVCETPLSIIAKRVGISDDACSQRIAELEKAGYIARESGRGLGTGRKRVRILGLITALVASTAIGTSSVDASSSTNFPASHNGSFMGINHAVTSVGEKTLLPR
jgi:DNA-binding IscR family transcriptional regulator